MGEGNVRMSKGRIVISALILAAGLALAPGQGSYAAPNDRIQQGVTAGDVDLAGMTQEEAKQTLTEYVNGLKGKKITLRAADGQSISVTAGQLGLVWKNPDLVQQAVDLGRTGNIVARYKALQDLKYKGKNFEIELDFERSAIAGIVSEQCGRFNVEAVNAQLVREDGVFRVTEGQAGYVVDEEASVAAISDYLLHQWDGQDGSVDLVMAVEEPQGKAEDLQLVKDVLGAFTTSYSTSGTSRSRNVENGCRLINGTTLYPGETFSAYDAVKPFSSENGYYMAGSYLNGQVVDSIGGGICQVSTTLYNAVLLSELEVTERHNHSMIVNYVDPSADAAIAESSGKDFKFVNNTPYPIYIEGHTENKKITFTIYGVETRDPGRTVSYVSEVLERKVPEQDQIVADASQPVGFIHTSAAHIGYRAQLWKVVKENGTEVSREVVNTSSYQMSPSTVTVGTATSDPGFSQMIQDAIATNDTGLVKSVVANIKAVQEAAAMSQEQLAEIAAAQAAAQQAAQDAEAGN